MSFPLLYRPFIHTVNYFTGFAMHLMLADRARPSCNQRLRTIEYAARRLLMLWQSIVSAFSVCARFLNAHSPDSLGRLSAPRFLQRRLSSEKRSRILQRPKYPGSCSSAPPRFAYSTCKTTDVVWVTVPLTAVTFSV